MVRRAPASHDAADLSVVAVMSIAAKILAVRGAEPHPRDNLRTKITMLSTGCDALVKVTRLRSLDRFSDRKENQHDLRGLRIRFPTDVDSAIGVC